MQRVGEAEARKPPSAGPGKETLPGLLVVLYLVFTPLTIASVFVAGHKVELSLMLAVALSVAFLIGLLTDRVGLGEVARGWSTPFWLFVAVGTVSLVLSPYLRGSYELGFIQTAGTSAILLASLYIGGRAAAEASKFLVYVRVLVLTVAVLAGIGLWQFLAVNVLHTGFMADFSFVNDIFPGADEPIWADPGNIGGESPVRRANSLATEPSFFAQILGVGAGLALLRLGLMGRAYSRSLAPVVPVWAAVLVPLGVLVALSIIGYFLLALTVFSLVVVLYRLDRRHLSQLLLIGGGMAVAGVLLAVVLGEDFVKKLGTIPLILQAAVGGTEAAPTESISALSLAANLSVALDNLAGRPLLGVGFGGHPRAYADLAPDWIYVHPALPGLQSMDGGSLFIRLLSETGLVGTALFLAGWLLVVLRARQAIQGALKLHEDGAGPHSPVLVASVGITASCLALVAVYMVRMGVYYDPPIWALIALTASVPALLKRSYSDTPKEAQAGQDGAKA